MGCLWKQESDKIAAMSPEERKKFKQRQKKEAARQKKDDDAKAAAQEAATAEAGGKDKTAKKPAAKKCACRAGGDRHGSEAGGCALLCTWACSLPLIRCQTHMNAKKRSLIEDSSTDD